MLIPPNKTRKYAYEQASKHAKFFWVVGTGMMMGGAILALVLLGVFKYLVFIMATQYGEMSDLYAYVFMAIQAAFLVTIVMGLVFRGYAYLYQYWDRGDIDKL